MIMAQLRVTPMAGKQWTYYISMTILSNWPFGSKIIFVSEIKSYYMLRILHHQVIKGTPEVQKNYLYLVTSLPVPNEMLTCYVIHKRGN